MTHSLTRSFLSGFLSTVLVFGVATVSAAEPLSNQVNSALTKKNLGALETLLTAGPSNVDAVLKALLKKTQKDMSVDPDFSNKMMSLAGEYAPQITPQSVPAICADLRRIVDSLKPDQAGSPLYKSIIDATESFSKAPAVVASGRPNECEQAWLQLSNQEALLAQTPGMRGPGLPPVTVGPGKPPENPSPTDKPSAD